MKDLLLVSNLRASCQIIRQIQFDAGNLNYFHWVDLDWTVARALYIHTYDLFNGLPTRWNRVNPKQCSDKVSVQMRHPVRQQYQSHYLISI